MRLIKIENCSYEKYNTIRNAIMSVIPFAIINQDYSKDLKIAIFNFWDVEYIPESLKKYIMQPPLSRENRALLHKKLRDIEI